jgi:hypothetical protein
MDRIPSHSKNYTTRRWVPSSAGRDLVITGIAIGICLAACCAVHALDAGPGIAPVLSKHPEGPRLARELAEADIINPTPLSDELYIVLLDACDESSVEVPLALGVIEVESGFDVDAVSPAGCYGLMQLNPEYFPSGLTAGENIRTGTEYLGSLLDRYGDTGAALTAYNAGHDTGDREYAEKVIGAAERWEGTEL